MNGKWHLGVVGLLVVGVGLVGCVEEEASVVIHSNVIGNGSFDPGDEEEGTPDQVNCQFDADFDDPEVWAAGRIDLEELEMEGQRLVRESDAGAERNRYMFRTVMENRLSDSRQVGATSGGEGDGFQELTLDKNDVMIKSATVRLVPVGEAAGAVPEAEWERRGTMLVQSGGGISAYGTPILDGSEDIDGLRNALQTAGVAPGQSEPFIAEVQLQGETLGGHPVHSNIVEYPVGICVSGCGEAEQPFTNPQCVTG